MRLCRRWFRVLTIECTSKRLLTVRSWGRRLETEGFALVVCMSERVHAHTDAAEVSVCFEPETGKQVPVCIFQRAGRERAR